MRSRALRRRAAAARATGALSENENGVLENVLDARDDGGAASHKSDASRESDAAALDVLCAMARAVPDALASTGRDDRGASDGILDILDPGSTVQSVGRSCTRGGATDVSAASTDARDSARDFFRGPHEKIAKLLSVAARWSGSCPRRSRRRRRTRERPPRSWTKRRRRSRRVTRR